MRGNDKPAGWNASYGGGATAIIIVFSFASVGEYGGRGLLAAGCPLAANAPGDRCTMHRRGQDADFQIGKCKVPVQRTKGRRFQSIFAIEAETARRGIAQICEHARCLKRKTKKKKKTSAPSRPSFFIFERISKAKVCIYAYTYIDARAKRSFFEKLG